MGEKSQFYRVVFRFGGRKYSHTLKTRRLDQARALVGGVEKTLLRLKLRLIELPEGANVVSFLLSEGRETGKHEARPVLTLKSLCEQYEAGFAASSMEENSLSTVKLHLQHFKRHLRENFPVQTLSGSTLQGYVDKRSKEKGHRGRRISPTTVKKEVTSLAGVWSWGVMAGLLTGTFPSRGLKYLKTAEKPPFRAVC